ncbi:metallophosphoesterase [Corynebacterium epidermidicanis]|uniref:Putative phosphohydrolase n=1 Tax=Corynebacterium epidermidicanis TaxID=1050174 RepID=A0A0G3GM13_9CORY|nr:metallophosphoesterase [Corynebacterium epidermidicanis]AKK02154.1 putative phosphohydrolase [Corynebacterium epidermidicanis]
MDDVSKLVRFSLSALAAGSVAGLGLAAYGYRSLTDFRLKHVTVPVLDPGVVDKEFTILHISDLHMLPSHRAKQAWVSSLDALNPDLVINTGDNLGSADAVPAVLQALSPLLHRPGLFVFGTNDYFGPRPVNPVKYLLGKKRKVSEEKLPWEGMRAAFIERGWHDATHKRVEFKVGDVRIAAAGVDDPHHDLDDYSLISGAPNADADLSLALTHSPEPRVLASFEADGYQLSLSGHTHGGQLCLPGERTIVTNCGIDRKRASGLHRFGKMWMHVSNGLGTSKYVPFRLWCAPSATLIHVTAA